MAFMRTPMRRLNRLLLDPKIDFNPSSGARLGDFQCMANSSGVSTTTLASSSSAKPGNTARAIGGVLMHVDLPADDSRTVHVANILKLKDGDAIRTGVVGGGLDDFGHITWQPDGKLTVSLRAAAALSRRRNSNSDFDRSTGHGGFSETSADTEAAGAFAATTRTAAEMGTANATTTEAAASGEVRWPARGRVDLLLAMPSPRVLARILPLVAAFGVDRLFLTGTAKVEKAYMASHLFQSFSKQRQSLRALLRLGLEQAGHLAHFPRVSVHPNLAWLLQDLDAGAFADLDRDQSHSTTTGTVAEVDGYGGVGGTGGGESVVRTESERRLARKSFGAAASSSSSSTHQAAASTSTGTTCTSTTREASVAAAATAGACYGGAADRTLRVVAHPASAYWPRSSSSLRQNGLDSSSGAGRVSSNSSNSSTKLSSGHSSSHSNSSRESSGNGSSFSSSGSSSRRPVLSLGSVPFPLASDEHELNFRSGDSCGGNSAEPKRLLLAVGPDGGWAVPHELDLFARHGFAPISLAGSVGTLKTEVALAALLARAYERLDDEDLRR